MSTSPASPWLERCRAAVTDVKAVLASMPTREERARPGRPGQGRRHDDRARCGRREAPCSRTSTRRTSGSSRRRSGSRGRARPRSSSTRSTALRTPSAGSRTSPSASLSPRASTMDDVVFGFVYDFGANEEWTAVRGGGAFLNGQPLTGEPKDPIEFLSIEATRADARARPAGEARAAHRPGPGDGRAGDHVLPPRSRPHRRRRLPQAFALGRLRRGAAARPRARVRDPGDRRPRSARCRSTSRPRSRICAAGNERADGGRSPPLYAPRADGALPRSDCSPRSRT